MNSSTISNSLSPNQTLPSYKIVDNNKKQDVSNSYDSIKRDEVLLKLKNQNKLSALSAEEVGNTLAQVKEQLLSTKGEELFTAQGNLNSENVASLLS